MKKKIAIFYGGKMGEKIKDFEMAKSKLGIELDLINYDEVYFDLKEAKGKKLEIKLRSDKVLSDYGVIYFKMAKSYGEEMALIMDALDDEVVIVDSVLKKGRPTDFCKIHQMKVLSEGGLNVPRSVMGRLDFLRYEAIKEFDYPVILKGSRGDRRTQVFKFFNDESWEKGWDVFKMREKEEGQRYMLQEYIINKEDYRVMVVGKKVLGVMKRATGENERLKDVFSVSSLPQSVLEKAVEAAELCQIEIAGVDVVFKEGVAEPYFWEVNKTPNYARFMEVTGINVTEEIVKLLADKAKNLY